MPARLSRTRLLGFTLLELIVTIVVLGVLAALAVPAFSAVADRSKDATLEAELEALGRGVAALAAFDGEITTAHLGEFLDAEGQAAEAIGSSARWVAVADADATGADGELAVSDATAGYLGVGTTVPNRGVDWAAYLVVSTSGAAVELAAESDLGTTGADALCFWGLTDTCESRASEPAPSSGGASGGGTEPVVTVLASDTFSRADGPLAGSATEEGGQTWQLLSGTVEAQLVGGRVVQDSGYSRSGVATGSASGDVAVAATLDPQGDGASQLLVRVVDGDNFIRLNVDATSWELRPVVGNVVKTVLASGPVETLPAAMSVTSVGSELTVRLNSAVVATVDDATHVGASMAGIGLYLTSAVDDFTVTDP